jgi:hypothetical protein
MVKAGIVGWLLFMWLSVAFLRRGFLLWGSVSDPYLRATVLGFTLTFAGAMVAAIVAPVFMQWFWTPVIGLMMGVNEAVLSGSESDATSLRIL